MANNLKNFKKDDALIYACYHNLDVKVLLKDNDIFSNIFKEKSIWFVFKEDDVPNGYDVKIIRFQDIVDYLFKLCEPNKPHRYYIGYYYISDCIFNMDAFLVFTKKELSKFLKKYKDKDKDLIDVYEKLLSK